VISDLVDGLDHSRQPSGGGRLGNYSVAFVQASGLECEPLRALLTVFEREIGLSNFRAYLLRTDTGYCCIG
jgi:hypothetical protein